MSKGKLITKKLVSLLLRFYLHLSLKVEVEITLDFIDWNVSTIGSFAKYTFFSLVE